MDKSSLDYLEQIKNRFANDIFATECAQIKILDAKPSYAKCEMKITRQHKNAVGAVMGGAIFTLADFCFAVASNGDGRNGFSVSLSAQISFIGSAKTDTLIAESQCIKEGRSTNYYIININDDAGNNVANICINGFKKTK
ncbi:MAG: PaaI family thioesterase [Treponema sp.]|jgi:acyl-CoA thioesterase|nr:PaaI family thioesterase [Treponema sp.]